MTSNPRHTANTISPSASPGAEHHPADLLEEEEDSDLYNHPLEPQVLREYRTLSHNLSVLSTKLSELSSSTDSATENMKKREDSDGVGKGKRADAVAIAEGLRGLERKTALACTALKSSVYGIVLQQQIEGQEAEVGQTREGSEGGS